MNGFDVLISVFVDQLRSGEFTMQLVEDIYRNAPEGMRDSVIEAINTRMEMARILENMQKS